VNREPKVACVETDCPYKDWPKGNELCRTCKPRWKFLEAIENGWTISCYATDATIHVGDSIDSLADVALCFDHERS